MDISTVYNLQREKIAQIVSENANLSGRVIAFEVVEGNAQLEAHFNSERVILINRYAFQIAAYTSAEKKKRKRGYLIKL